MLVVVAQVTATKQVEVEVEPMLGGHFRLLLVRVFPTMWHQARQGRLGMAHQATLLGSWPTVVVDWWPWVVQED